MQLVYNWKSAWRWFSMQTLALLAVLPLVWPSIPPEAQAWLPEEYRPYVLVALAIGGIAGRLVSQPSADKP